MKTILTSLIVLLFISSSCKKLVEVKPPITSTNGDGVFNEDGSAIAVITGIYSNMSKNIIGEDGLLTNVFLLTGLTGDELRHVDDSNPYLLPYYNNTISPLAPGWTNIYKMIFTVNSAVEQMPKGTTLSTVVRSQLMGEAKFIRALCYFYLVNLYGDVPMPLSTDYKINEDLPRSIKSDVYEQIITDLKEAQNLLNANYVQKDAVSTSLERVRPNKYTAIALLARVYLYTGKYAEAEKEASVVIEKKALYELVELNDVFLKGSREAIWQLQPVGVTANFSANSQEGYLLKILPFNERPLVVLTDGLVTSFDARDQRRFNWINTVKTNGGSSFTYAYKYKIGQEQEPTKEYSTVFRLAEQYLIRAEARIRQGNVIEGIADLNAIRKRATDHSVLPLNQFAQLSENLPQTEALLAVEQERRHELFTEWGHRWFDLKRTNRANEVLGELKGSYWQSTDQLFPIPQSDVSTNRPQNPGYTN
jgi:hypothetical protein